MHVTVCCQLFLIMLFREAECNLSSHDHTNLTHSQVKAYIFMPEDIYWIHQNWSQGSKISCPGCKKKSCIHPLRTSLPIMKAIDVQLLQEQILKYTNCTEFERPFRGGCDVWLVRLGGVFFLVVDDNFGLPMGESSFEDEDRPPNGLIVKEVNLSLSPLPLYLYKSLTVMKTVIV